MSRHRSTPTYYCDVCGQPTSRLLGMAAIVASDTRGSGLREARGCCRAHRAEVPGRFLAHARELGELTWSFADDGGEPTELRPAEVPGWQQAVDHMFTEFIESFAPNPGAVYTPLQPGDGIPTDCPHCSAPLSWDTGPHVADARTRDHARAWECTGCGAAGLLA